MLAALASWLDARAHGGRWLLRIEDIDAPRCDPVHADRIEQSLRALGLNWDGPVLLQSNRLARYEQVFTTLQQQTALFACTCTRKQLAALSQDSSHVDDDGETPYPGHCRHQQHASNDPHLAHSWRLRVAAGSFHFDDRIAGPQTQHTEQQCGDFIVRRRDGLFSYQLVVVVDDADQGINHVVRGADLLSSCGRQMALQKLLGYPHPQYMHLPLLNDSSGHKLSKQTGADEVDWQHAATDCLNQALASLGQKQQSGSVPQLLSQAIADWNVANIPRPEQFFTNISN